MASIRACFRPCGRPLRPAGAEALARERRPWGCPRFLQGSASQRHRIPRCQARPAKQPRQNHGADISTMGLISHQPSQTSEKPDHCPFLRSNGSGQRMAALGYGIHLPPPEGATARQVVLQTQRFRRRRIRTLPSLPSRRWRGPRDLRRAPLHRCCPRSGAGRETGSGSPRRTGR